MTKNLFFVGIILAASGVLSPPLALTAGLAYGLLLNHPYHLDSKRLAKFLLQAAVVCLGFGMNLSEVIKAGRSGFVYTALGISIALTLGILLGRVLRVGKTQSFLISAGTAVCGGSAIAALGPVAQANDDEMAVSLGTVYVLNSVALFVFPAIGAALHLSQSQFGLWSALAIHDTSSVVGAAAKYGTVALAVGTTIKLARALWIVPLAMATAAVKKSGACSTSVVHPLFLHRFGDGKLLATDARRVYLGIPVGQSRSRSHLVPYRIRNLTPDAERNGRKTDAPRPSVVDRGRRALIGGDNSRNCAPLKVRHETYCYSPELREGTKNTRTISP